MKQNFYQLRLIAAMLMMMSVGLAHGQTAYTYVQQNGTAIAADGLAGFDISASPSVEFVNGKAVMTINGNTVVTLPMADGGQLVVKFETPTATELKDLTVNEVPVTVKTTGYGTFYSPFQISVPESGDVKVYAPTYDEDTHILTCNNTTEMSGVIPAGTGLLLKNAGNITFVISSDASNEKVSDLSGSALKIAKSEVAVGSGDVIFTLGHESTTNNYGFFEYAGEYLNPSKAYLIAGSLNSTNAKYVSFNFDDEVSGISTPITSQGDKVRKYLENGHVVILKNGKKYNANGQEIE